jgi:Fic family protein
MDMALAQDEGRTMRLYSLSARFMHTRDEYYTALGDASTGTMDITPWLLWFLTQVESAAHASETTIAHILSKARFWLRHAATELNARQRKALNRMLDTGPGGFVGGMTNEKYRNLTKTSPATAQRDLADLVEKDCLVLNSAGRSVRYEIFS